MVPSGRGSVLFFSLGMADSTSSASFTRGEDRSGLRESELVHRVAVPLRSKAWAVERADYPFLLKYLPKEFAIYCGHVQGGVE